MWRFSEKPVAGSPGRSPAMPPSLGLPGCVRSWIDLGSLVGISLSELGIKKSIVVGCEFAVIFSTQANL
jgi:hypothetical protein